MIKNIDPKKNPWTTIIGIVFLVIGLGTILMPLYAKPENDISEILKYIFLVSGVGLVLAPEAIINIFFDWIKRKLSSI